MKLLRLLHPTEANELCSIGPFSRDRLSFSYENSINVLMIMNGVGAIGRVIPGFLADLYLGPLNVVTPAAAICTILLFCWMAIQSSTALYVWAVFYGKPPNATQRSHF